MCQYAAQHALKRLCVHVAQPCKAITMAQCVLECLGEKKYLVWVITGYVPIVSIIPSV